MNSAIYTGKIRHRRLTPVRNDFQYRLFMMYLDLGELPQLFDNRWFWSARRPALARFLRADYHGDPALPLEDAVRGTVADQLGFRPDGPIRMLTHLRYFGHCFNPVTFYYCFHQDGETLQAILAEITNTPWKERHAYALDCRSTVGSRFHRFRFSKTFHVSPFLPMDLQYDWLFRVPDEHLAVHMEDMKDGEKVFDATLDLERKPLTGRSLAQVLTCYPFMTLTVVAGIYWQALKLKLKGAPFHEHPGHHDSIESTTNSPHPREA